MTQRNSDTGRLPAPPPQASVCRSRLRVQKRVNGVIVHLTQGSISGVAGASPTAAIADTDVGIPADELAQVTKPFYQIDSRLARKHEETGLGLALVYSLVAAYAGLHEAELALDSTVVRGAVVTLLFPRTRALADENWRPPTEEKMRRTITAKGGSDSCCVADAIRGALRGRNVDAWILLPSPSRMKAPQ